MVGRSEQGVRAPPTTMGMAAREAEPPPFPGAMGGTPAMIEIVVIRLRRHSGKVGWSVLRTRRIQRRLLALRRR